MRKLEIARPERSRRGNWKLEIPAKRDGQALVELLVAFAFASVLLPGLLTGLVASREGKAQQIQRLEATGLLREAQEALRVVRETNWSMISTNGTYHPQDSGTTWTLSAGSESINGYTRQIIISDTFRDSNGNIIPSGGMNDPSTKKAVLSVSWGTPYPSEVTSTIYLTRYLNNATLIDTSEADFDAGSHSGTTTVNNNGGEVVLGAGGGGDWCTPQTSLVEELDLPKTGKATSVTTVFGEAYAGTGENSSGESFADILISDTDPPVASISGTINGYKTNDIYGEQNYGYIATDNNFKEVVIIDITNVPFSEGGYFNAPGNNFGESVFVANNIGYVVVKENLYNFDLSSKNGSRPILDTNGVTLSKEGTAVFVVGNYAYVSIKGDNNVQLDIIDISNPTNMVKVGTADVNNQSAQDVYINTSGTRAYIVTNATSSEEREFHIVNVENKSSPVKIGPGYYTNGMNPEAVEVVTGNRAIIVGQGGEEYQAVNISNELVPVRCGGFHVDSGIFDSASVLEPDGDAYTYIVTGDAISEFKIIEGGPGGQFSTTGTFTSRDFNAGTSVAYNRIIPNFLEPSGTNLEFQVAAASVVDGSCTNASYFFLGPDGTSSTFFATSSAIPLINNGQSYVNPGQCFRYRAYFSTTNPNASPILTDVTVNYSP